LVERGLHAEAVRFGDAALWADLSNFDVHYWFGTALAKTGDRQRAHFELESAMLCDAPKERKAAGYRALIKSYRERGQLREAREQTELLRQLDTDNPALGSPGL
jgi:tetratricopeptide (TPR) repeat protein